MQDVGSVKDFRREEVRGFIHVHRPNEAHIVGYLNHACCLNHLFEIMMEMLPGIDKRFVVCCGKNVVQRFLYRAVGQDCTYIGIQSYSIRQCIQDVVNASTNP